MLAFKHRPCLGDTIYGLPIMKELGGGTLYLDPRIHGGSPTYKYWLLENPRECPIVGHWYKKLELLIPALKQQEYINEVKMYEGEHFDIDLDYYVIYHMGGHRRTTIVDAHYMGLAHKSSNNWNGKILQSPKPTPPWLSLENNSIKAKGEGKPIVWANTGSWGSAVPIDMRFIEELNKMPGVNELIYNCTPKSRAHCFNNNAGCRHIGTPRPPQNLLEWFEIIDACSLFIGNQSFPLSLAVGFGKSRMFEECTAFPNCTFGHDNEFAITNSHEKNMEMALKFLSTIMS